MKSIALFVALLGALVISSVSLETRASNTARRQSAITTFERTVMLHGVALKGEYLFVHDDAAMARGEACTYVYKGTVPAPEKLVASFHCVAVQRAKARGFIVRTVDTSPNTTEVLEFQFGGDTEGHAVPTSIDHYLTVKK